MRLDVLAEEIQFVDHLAPVWRALPEVSRGRFMTHFAFLKHAKSLGVDAVTRTIDGSNPILVASLGDMNTARKLGRTSIARMEHGIGQSYAGDPRHPIAIHGSYAGGAGAECVSLFLVPNETSGKRWRDAYPDARVEVIGCPKLDELRPFTPAESGRPIVGVSVHWNWHWIPETLSAFIPYHEAFIALAKTHSALGHAHPKAAPEVSRWFAKKSIPYAEHLTDIMEKASVFVCDNSSAMYEFAATGRPVVVMNLPEYRRSVRHGLRFWDAAKVGVNVDGPAGLSAAVDIALTDPPEVAAAREAALDIVYARRTGASLLAAQTLLDWMGALPEPAPAPARSGTMTRPERVAAYRTSL